jgi:hypothetical protein
MKKIETLYNELLKQAEDNKNLAHKLEVVKLLKSYEQSKMMKMTTEQFIELYTGATL